MRTVKVALGDRSYSIRIGRNLLSRLGAECRRLGLGNRCAIISDRNVAPRYAAVARRALSAAGFESVLVTVPAGEAAQSLANAHSCYNQPAAHRLQRKSFVVALGGGLVGELAGVVVA